LRCGHNRRHGLCDNFQLPFEVLVVGNPVRIERQRGNLRAQEVIRTRGSDGSKAREVLRAYKLQGFGIIAEMSNLPASPRHQSAQARHQGGSDCAPFFRRSNGDNLAAEGRSLYKALVQVVGRLSDQLDCIIVTGAGAITPANETVARQDNPAKAGARFDIVPQLEGKLKAGPSPREPAHRPLIKLSSDLFPGRAGGDRRDCIRMDMVDMRVGQQRMQGRIYRGWAWVETKSAMGKIRNDLVFQLRPPVKSLKRQQFIHVQRSESLRRHGTDVAP